MRPLYTQVNMIGLLCLRHVVQPMLFVLRDGHESPALAIAVEDPARTVFPLLWCLALDARCGGPVVGTRGHNG